MTGRLLPFDFGTGSLAIYLRLSAMAFIDAAILACVVPLLAIYMRHAHGFSAREMSTIYAVGPFAALLAPLLVGQLADRLFSAQKVLAAVNLLRTGALFAGASADSYGEFLIAMTLVFLLQVPSLTLCSAVSFHHLKDARHFGGLRVWGSFGWIVIVWLCSLYLERFPAAEQARQVRGCFYLAAALSLVHAIYALTLPETPPAKGKNPFAVIDALYLLKSRNFLALSLGGFVMSVAVPFYFVLQGLFMVDANGGLGISIAQANRASTLAQSLELFLFPALALLFRKLGTRWVLFLGLAAWPVRFAAFMLKGPAWLVIGAQALHGVNVVFWAASAAVVVDLLAKGDVRASAQGLYAIASSGIGALVGQLAVGQVYELYEHPEGGHDWTSIFAVPFLFTSLGALLFLSLYREPTPVEGTRVEVSPA
ncbi:MAG TPA: MFS transporter [Polyangiaceae bacterium]